MTCHGSFHPIARDVGTAAPVLFALVLDTPEQRGALREETLLRISAIQELSETLVASDLESPGTRWHGAILEAVAILSRDVRGLLEASFHPGP